ncbi:MAG: cupin domain-containing protein, partial [Terriglobia bacterium]
RVRLARGLCDTRGIESAETSRRTSRKGAKQMLEAIEAVKTVQSSEGRALSVIGEIIHIKLRGEDTGGAFAMFEDVTPPRGGVPPHIHHLEDETFYVIEGEYEFTVGGSATRAGPGTTLFCPRDVPHSFRNIGTGAGRTLTIVSPAGFEKFFEEVDHFGRVEPAPLERLVELGQKYGLNFVTAGV